MARPYGSKFLVALEKNKEQTLGIQLAKLCVKANLPATLVAKALNTSSTTVYSWFRGQGVRERKRRTVEVFIDLLKADIADGRLPVKDLDEAAEYISEMIGEELS